MVVVAVPESIANALFSDTILLVTTPPVAVSKFVTLSVPPIIVLPVSPATTNLSGLHSIPPFAVNFPVTVSLPPTVASVPIATVPAVIVVVAVPEFIMISPFVSVDDIVLASNLKLSTFNSPFIVVLPFVSIINLSVLHIIPPFAVNNPVIVILLPTVALSLIATVSDIILVISLPEFIVML